MSDKINFLSRGQMMLNMALNKSSNPAKVLSEPPKPDVEILFETLQDEIVNLDEIVAGDILVEAQPLLPDITLPVQSSDIDTDLMNDFTIRDSMTRNNEVTEYVDQDTESDLDDSKDVNWEPDIGDENWTGNRDFTGDELNDMEGNRDVSGDDMEGNRDVTGDDMEGNRDVTVDDMEGNRDVTGDELNDMEGNRNITGDEMKGMEGNRKAELNRNGEKNGEVEIRGEASGGRKRKSKVMQWQRTKNIKMRMEGRRYMGCVKLDGKYSYSRDRPEREMGKRKCTERCKKMNRKCDMITDEERLEIFNAFWRSMDWKEKKVYINSLVERLEVQERKVPMIAGHHRRNCSLKYFLKKGDKRYQVCKPMFLSTLAIGEKSIYDWIEKSTNGIPHTPAKRKHRNTAFKDLKREHAKTFLNDLPKMPSHYCRSTSSKTYLEPVFASFAELYRVFERYCKDKNNPVAGRKLFAQMFDNLNLSLFSPKKDQCDICCAYEQNNIGEEEYTEHIKKKEEARIEKNKDKERALIDPTLLVVTLDLQALLMCPMLQASALYYKTKLGCHNFTIYNVATKEVMCYFWHESEGDLTANSFCSCIYNYLNHIDETISEIIIYSDGCNYQNRNVTLSNKLLLIAKQKGVTIIHKYLERGHTQMECDSIHSVIERKLKRKPIYHPQNYVDKIRDARLEKPYVVQFLSHNFFKNYSALKYYTSIRPGSKVGDSVVTNLRVIQYDVSGEIMYKLNYGEDFSSLPTKAKVASPSTTDVVFGLHDQPLPIKATKYRHLQELKSAIPQEFHSFYDNLPHE